MGNPADVFKHIVLLGLLQHLKRKQSGFFVLDTHAGKGLYDLASIEAIKTGEFSTGIGKLWNAPVKTPLLTAYLAAIGKMNSEAMKIYPGSPLIIRDQLREHDSAAFCELHPEDYKTLKALMNNAAVAVHHRDGYEALGALLPPKHARGLILIDPPYEDRAELEILPQAIARGYRKFPQAIWAVWYPVKDRATLWQFEEAMIAGGIPRQMVIEFLLNEEADSRMLNGSGMLLINPPFGLTDALLPALEEAQSYLAAGGKVICKDLVSE